MGMLIASVPAAFAGTVPDEALRHMARGEAAVETARSQDDYERAITEFQAAARIAPNWADPFYNLGLVQEKAQMYGDAAASLRRYLALDPNAADAATVKTLIYKLEYKAEQEISREEALNIFGSLLDRAKWDFRGEDANHRSWIRGFRREGDRIAITYVHDLRGQNIDDPNVQGHLRTEYAEMVGKTNKLRFQLYFDNWYRPGNRGSRGATGVLGDYELEISSRQKVVGNSVETYPRVGNIASQTHRKRYEYIRK